MRFWPICSIYVKVSLRPPTMKNANARGADAVDEVGFQNSPWLGCRSCFMEGPSSERQICVSSSGRTRSDGRRLGAGERVSVSNRAGRLPRARRPYALAVAHGAGDAGDASSSAAGGPTAAATARSAGGDGARPRARTHCRSLGRSVTTRRALARVADHEGAIEAPAKQILATKTSVEASHALLLDAAVATHAIMEHHKDSAGMKEAFAKVGARVLMPESHLQRLLCNLWDMDMLDPQVLTDLKVAVVADDSAAGSSVGTKEKGMNAVRRALKSVMRLKNIDCCTVGTIDYGIEMIEMSDAGTDDTSLPPLCACHSRRARCAS
jgi:hypothetical protein